MSGNNDFLDGLAIFTEEARELIEQMEDILLRAEAGDSSEDDLHALFRCAHTIKGSGGLFNLDEVVRFTHVVENILDELRKGVIGFSSELISILLESQDHISGMISAIASDEPSDAEERSNELIQKLKAISAKKTNEASAAESTGHSVAIETPPETVLSNSGGEIMSSDNWHISLRFKPEVLTYGMDPLTVISYLSNYGRITHLETVCDALPELLEADPERCYLGFEVALASTASKEEIASTFEFIAENAQITMLPPHSRTAEFIAMMELIPEGIARLGDILIACGTLTKAELDAALSLQVKSNGSPRLGEILIERGVVKPLVVDAAVDKQRRNRKNVRAKLRISRCHQIALIC